jgi:eukaryotic-like serine/threonine-protein kinase
LIYRFSEFEVDKERFSLCRNGMPVQLEPKVLRLLLYLVDHHGRLVGKQELLDALWADAFVTENALTRAVGMLRRALDDDPREPRFIQTVTRVGYRFVAEVSIAGAPPDSAPLTIPGLAVGEGSSGAQAVSRALSVSRPFRWLPTGIALAGLLFLWRLTEREGGPGRGRRGL